MTAPGNLLYNDETQQPQPKKPSLLDRLLARFFPEGASPYGSLLTPDQLSGARRGALQRMAATLLAESGPRPQGTTGPLEGLGHALQAANWPGALEQAGQSATQINELQNVMQRRRAIESIVSSYPAKPGETPAEIATRIADMQGAIARVGGPEAEQVSQLLNNQLRAIQGAAELNKSTTPVDPGQLWSNVMGRITKWEGVREAIQNYKQLRDITPPLSPQASAALVAASRAITSALPAAGEGAETGILAKIPEVGHLIEALAQLTGNHNLDDKQRRDLIEVTDRVVARLAEERRRVRQEAERQLRDAKFTEDQIRTYLPSFVDVEVPRRRSGAAGRIRDDVP